MSHRSVWSAVVINCVTLVSGFSCSPASAALKIYYDPLTGNVSFDTRETRSGEVWVYDFMIDRRKQNQVPWRFRNENLVRLSNGSLFTSEGVEVGDSTQSLAWKGLYTIGDVLPSGWTSDYWATAFAGGVHNSSKLLQYGYVDIVGGGAPPPAEFIFGRPNEPFVNRWDLVDPATLSWARTATLVYHAWDGEVFVDTTGAQGGHISMLLLTSDGKFLPKGASAFVSGVFSSATKDEVFVAQDAIEAGMHSLGKILPAGLSPSQYQAAFESAKFIGRAGFNGGSFDFVTHGVPMTLTYAAVPEPTALLLLIIGITLGANYRSRS